MTEHVRAEIASQPACWIRAAGLLDGVRGVLPAPGERVAVVGCGTSWFVAMSYAALREQAGHGETDAFAASEAPIGRGYDAIVAITRSGTTTEVLDLLAAVAAAGAGAPRTVVLTAVAGSPAVDAADAAVVLDFADEQAVVQTRSATSVLALLRAHLGQDLGPVVADAEKALAEPLDGLTGIEQATFVGRGWTVGLAHEAALKLRESAQFWAEAYPAMDYRHGPISIAEPGRLVWSFGPPPVGLADEVEATGATFVASELDPLAQLVVAQRLAVALAESRGLDADRPRHLTRSVVLPGA
ncbi:SIS domain-containing protein [Jiangella alkaliphila]|uniref:Fructoselysine-6-P-deglycase FrlB with duplicated sugar isomerase (SIS) domain n=1 Tax=Jiangella alkaliphila TaxID=419479 RepID=A0A1H2IKI1_9ACTN|nr:SIS domain-containing protein [Jiangella alkaliphila]SDU44593.1 Fructoselysine-6-P-deglycase FrlB with duplicated sugar isomerase (SIS) domain [Jiangella alkaliphila]